MKNINILKSVFLLLFTLSCILLHSQTQETHLDGELHVKSNDAQQISIKNEGAGGTTWLLSSTQNLWNAGGGKFLINNSSNTTNSTFVITGDRNVGIGELNPLSKFSVNGKINVGDDNLTDQEGDIRFRTLSKQFEGYNGTTWNSFTVSSKIQNADGNSIVQVWEGASSDNIRFTLDGDERMRFLDNSSNVPRMEIYGTGNNIAIGDDAGLNLNSVDGENVVIGHLAGSGISDGEKNVFIGFEAGKEANYDENVGIGYEALQTVGKTAASTNEGRRNSALGGYAGWRTNKGYENVFVGFETGVNISDGYSNTFVGANSGNATISGHHNTSVGRSAGSATVPKLANYNTNVGESAGYNASGDFNVRVGRDAGRNNDGDNNVFIGKEAGYNQDVSNTLIISNDRDEQLIYGEFDNKLVRINGELNTDDGDIVMKNLGVADFDKGIKWSETNNAVFGMTYDGEGTDTENRLHIQEYVPGGPGKIMTIKANGNVGVGVTNPQVEMDVDGTLWLRQQTLSSSACNSTSEYGKIAFDSDTKKLAVCANIALSPAPENPGWFFLH